MMMMMMMQILTWEKVLVTQVDVDAGVKARDHAVERSLFQAHACSTHKVQKHLTTTHHGPREEQKKACGCECK